MEIFSSATFRPTSLVSRRILSPSTVVSLAIVIRRFVTNFSLKASTKRNNKDSISMEKPTWTLSMQWG